MMVTLKPSSRRLSRRDPASDEEDYITLCDLDGPSSPRSTGAATSKP